MTRLHAAAFTQGVSFGVMFTASLALWSDITPFLLLPASVLLLASMLWEANIRAKT